MSSAWDATRKRRRPSGARRLDRGLGAVAALRGLRGRRFLHAALERRRPDVYKVVAADTRAFEKADPAPAIPSRRPARGPTTSPWPCSASSSARFPRPALAEYAAAAARQSLPRTLTSAAAASLNLLIKDNLLKRAAREAELVAAGTPPSTDSRRTRPSGAVDQAGAELDYYVNGQYAGLYDERNFPEFPAGDAYLGPTQYFAMGDNRYNSLDFRYRTGNFSIKPLDPADPSSVLYYSNIDPFALDLRFIEGYALFRIWPPSRIGAIR